MKTSKTPPIAAPPLLSEKDQKITLVRLFYYSLCCQPPKDADEAFLKDAEGGFLLCGDKWQDSAWEIIGRRREGLVWKEAVGLAKQYWEGTYDGERKGFVDREKGW